MSTATPVSVELAAGSLTVSFGDGTELSEMRACCRLAAWEDVLGGPWRELGGWGANGGHLEAECGPLLVRLDVDLSDGRVALGLSAVAITKESIHAIGLNAAVDVAGAEPEWILHNGYQSWDPAGQLPARSAGAGEAAPKRESWWTAGLAGDGGAGLALAAASASRWPTSFELHGSRLSILQRAAPAMVERPVMWVAEAGSAWTGESVAATSGGDVRKAIGTLLRGGLTGEAPQGWLSWYHYGPWVTRDDVVGNASELVDGTLAGLGYRVVQVDDGWQEAYGDWRPNSKFGPSMAPMCERLASWGLVPGIWTAPFLVSAASDLADRAPAGWFVTDPETGSRVVDHRHTVFGPMYVLDAREGAVLAHLERVFAGLRADGFRYFKIDFLYAGAYAGLGVLRAGVEAIRRGAGEDAFLVACGAPLMPVVGLVQSCRVGQDTASPIYDFELGAPRPTIFGDEVASVARNVAARHILAPWFVPDPDVALVGGNFSLEQARQVVTVAVLSGGPFFASDDLREIPPSRLALLQNPEVLALAGGAPAVPDWEPAERDLPPSIWRKGDVVAAFNWSSQPRRVEVRWAGSGLVRDLWERRDLGVVDGVIAVEVAASSVSLMSLQSG